MSGRLLRRVLKERDEKTIAFPDPYTEASTVDDEDEDEQSNSTAATGRLTNPFDLLDGEEDDQLQDQSHDTTVKEPTARKPAGTVPSSNQKSKKKKKKSKQSSKAEESIDSILEELSINTKASGNNSLRENANEVHYSGKKNGVPSILVVDPKFLKAENELRKIFGSKVVNSFENQRSVGSSRQVHGARRASYNFRKTFLATPLGHWPRWDNSLTMELLETKDGVQYFRYVHSPSYKFAQEAFEMAKAANDINAIGAVLAHNAYHIDALLTFAELFKYSGEHQTSSETIEKCLYALECAWHPLFTPLQGNCHLKYNHDTNKPLFLTLFSHMRNMDRRGCHRSALEVCKLLLSLDSDDPKGALFCIDYFSIRAQEYRWLEQFVEEYRCDNSLWLFPNFSYSLAVARLHLEHEDDASGDKATSTDLMKQALMLHPLVLQKLVAKAPMKEAVWTQILKHPFFGSAEAGSPSLEHLINIYVERSYILWRFPELQKLLKDAAFLVIESLKENNSEARDWDCVRKEAFSSEKNEYSHLMVSDFSDVIPTIPPEEIRDFMVGPPQLHEIQDAEREAIPVRARAAPREIIGRNAAIVFLESLLPWADYGVDRNREPHDHDQNDHGQDQQ
ncbi:transcription factor 25-like [Zingiber officinale]|uniref:Transcription factor 25 n=1 Tax=Zingiber officinale TaxID=94328 RepID=A0A8J5IEV6_ZINOF|nr:transcription factor 25-like [Zingiber officinale]KAG6539230.1 hypothetical protein ZIOFF_004385 [Zingiber officinale]